MSNPSKFLFALSLPLVVGAAAAQSTSANASFGNVTSNSTTAVCFNVNYGGNYYPQSGTGSFSTPGGNVYINTSNQIQPGQNCLNAQFTQGANDGAITGSSTVHYASSNGGQGLDVNFTSSGQSTVVNAQAAPAYQILSILYTPPGDHSSSGFSSTSSAGAVNTIASNYGSNDTISVSGGIAGATAGVSFSTGMTSGDSTSYTTSASATSGTQLNTVQQNIDHDQDQVYLWLNPAIKVQQTGSNSGVFSVSTIDANGNYNSGAPMDIVNVNLQGLKNPTLIPLSTLEAQNPKPGVTLPGLSIICKQRVPDNQCTQQNACGCTPSDFQTIVNEDELNGAQQANQPNNIDANRYVYVNYLTLEGPQQQGAGPVTNNFSITDSSMNSQSYSQGKSYSVGFTEGYSYKGPFSLSITNTNTFTYGETQTAGSTNGNAHTGSVNLGSSKVGCQEYVDVYEDTVYHTFAYALSQAPPANCQ